MSKSPTKQLFSTQEAAELLGLTDRRIRQLCKSEEIDAVKVNPVAWVLTKDAIDSFALSRSRN